MRAEVGLAARPFFEQNDARRVGRILVELNAETVVQVIYGRLEEKRPSPLRFHQTLILHIQLWLTITVIPHHVTLIVQVLRCMLVAVETV